MCLHAEDRRNKGVKRGAHVCPAPPCTYSGRNDIKRTADEGGIAVGKKKHGGRGSAKSIYLTSGRPIELNRPEGMFRVRDTTPGRTLIAHDAL